MEDYIYIVAPRALLPLHADRASRDLLRYISNDRTLTSNGGQPKAEKQHRQHVSSGSGKAEEGGARLESVDQQRSHRSAY